MDLKRLRELQESLEVYGELDEGAAEDVAARAVKLARQKKGTNSSKKSDV